VFEQRKSVQMWVISLWEWDGHGNYMTFVRVLGDDIRLIYIKTLGWEGDFGKWVGVWDGWIRVCGKLESFRTSYINMLRSTCFNFQSNFYP
jgi:hypothetical protein